MLPEYKKKTDWAAGAYLGCMMLGILLGCLDGGPSWVEQVRMWLAVGLGVAGLFSFAAMFVYYSWAKGYSWLYGFLGVLLVFLPDKHRAGSGH